MIKFNGVAKTKSLGKMSGGSIGVSTSTNAEITSAEYAKGTDGKAKASAKGNKQVKLNLKVVREITKKDGGKVNIPSFMNVTYYESDWSPKLKEVKPTDKLKKFAQVSFNTGGLIAEGKDSVFGNFQVRNYKGQDDKPKNSVSIFGGNVKQPTKKDGVYYIKDYDGKDVEFVLDTSIKATVKGFIEDVTDTERFITNNYDANKKTLNFNMFYLENAGGNKYDTFMPCTLENATEDRVMDFIKFIKDNTEVVVGMKGSVVSTPIYGEVEDNGSVEFGEYSFGGMETLGYEARLVIDYDEIKNNWVIQKTTNTGKLIRTTDDAVVEEVKEDLF
jgi:hypothetical protein